MKIYLCFVLIGVSLVNANILYDLSKYDINSVNASHNFTGKVVLVTGSNSGIGKGIAELFSALGAEVVVTGRNAQTVKKVADEVQELSPKKLKPLQVVGDVTKSADLERLINQTITAYGRLDILVNNAGIGPRASIRDKNFMEVFDSILNTNLRSAAELNHLAVPYLLKTKGSIVHISSIGGIVPSALTTPYSVSKAAMIMMTQCLALELGPLGVRVNTVSPGVTRTNAIPDDLAKKAIKVTSLRRIAEVLDIARGVVFLSSSDASFITGANLVIDGGLVYTINAMWGN